MTGANFQLTMQGPQLMLVLSLLVFLFNLVDGFIGDNGLCSLYVFTPFTNNGATRPSLVSPQSDLMNPGFSHLAAALMAMEDFNKRDPRVVPELADEHFQNCRIYFDRNKSAAFDSGSDDDHLASRNLAGQKSLPCAIAGPFDDLPVLELSTMAQASGFPLVAHRGFNLRIISSLFSPYSCMVFPDLYEHIEVVVEFLYRTNRTNFISLLYSLTDTSTQRQQAFAAAMDLSNMSWSAHAFESFTEPVGFQGLSIHVAMKQMKDRGFKTFLVSPGILSSDVPLIANAAEDLGMNNGQYFWIWFCEMDPSLITDSNANLTKLMAGSAWVTAGEPFLIDPANNSFFAAWRAQDSKFVESLNSMNPIAPHMPGYVFAKPDYFQTVDPEYGAGFMYDAVMAIGMGGCLADLAGPNVTFVHGSSHLNGIRQVKFQGSTGLIAFTTNDTFQPGQRLIGTSPWAVFNLLPPGSNSSVTDPFHVTDVMGAGAFTWITVAPFVFADGRTVPPNLLRDPPPQNYLNPSLRALGLSLMATTLTMAVASHIWVFVHREHRVVAAAQPHFLYVLAGGACITSGSIFTISFDESYGWSEHQLSRACMATLWLVAVGHVITYGALFAKLWRVNKVLQFARRKIEVRHVVWPVVSLVAAAIAILITWTVRNPMHWERVETNDATGESIGRCTCNKFAAYISPLIIIMIFPTVLTEYMAYKTKDVDDAYSESWWIFILVLLQLEVIVITLPLVVILRDVSTNARYLGFVFILWIFPMSTLLLIMVPKYLSYRRHVSGHLEGTTKRGDAHGTVHVSGLNKHNSPHVSSMVDGRGGHRSSKALMPESMNSHSTPHVSTTDGHHGSSGASIPELHGSPRVSTVDGSFGEQNVAGASPGNGLALDYEHSVDLAKQNRQKENEYKAILTVMRRSIEETGGSG